MGRFGFDDEEDDHDRNETDGQVNPETRSPGDLAVGLSQRPSSKLFSCYRNDAKIWAYKSSS